MTATRRIALAVLVWVGTFAVLRVSALAPERCPPADAASIDAAATAAGTWIVGNQSEDGRYLYEYDREDDRVVPGYNIVRHAGVTMSLYQLVRAGHPEFLASADVGLRLMLDALVPAGGGLALVDNASQARVGASALMIAALAQRREATAEGRYDAELRALGRFLVGQITPRGQVLSNYDLPTSVPVPSMTSRYATGEAAWALAQLHNLFPDEGWSGHAFLILDYLATARDEVEALDFAPWPDQWAAYTLAELAREGLAEHHVAYARALAARFGMLLRVESQKGGWPLPGIDTRARGAGLGVWIEGAGALSYAVSVDARLADLAPPLAHRVSCGAGILVRRQPDAAEAASWPSPEKVAGAWFREGITRMDDQQHSLTGLLLAAGKLRPVGG